MVDMNILGEKVADLFGIPFEGNVKVLDGAIEISLQLKYRSLTVAAQNETWLMFRELGANRVRFFDEEGTISVRVEGKLT